LVKSRRIDTTKAKVGGVEAAAWPMSMVRKSSDFILRCLPIPSTANPPAIPTPTPAPIPPSPMAIAAPSRDKVLTISETAIKSTGYLYLVATAM
jgi:hypothetical protein